MKDLAKPLIFGLFAFTFLLFSTEEVSAGCNNCMDYTYCPSFTGKVFAGYNSCGNRWPVHCCYPGDVGSCSTGINSQPSCSPPPPPPPPPSPPKPALSPWCDSNCVTANTRPDSTYNSCGSGWSGFSTMWCRSVPPGEQCGTCTGAALCGDGKITSPENCDDGNKNSGDGCSSSCQTEFGFNCPTVGQTCSSSCGDGRKAPNEACDDSNTRGGDGCSVDCRLIEPNYICNGNEPSRCNIANDICWNGIDDNKNGVIDENCRGCADLNGDNRVNFNDFFLLGDCAGATSPTGGCSALAFYNSDWNKNNNIEVTGEVRNCTSSSSGTLCIGDLDSDKDVDFDDFFIFADCVGGKTNGRCDSSKFNKADLNGNGLIDQHEIDRINQESVIRGSDGNCFLQNWAKNVPCSQQQCDFSGIGGICISDIQCGAVAKCSFGKRQELVVGHCCAQGQWWDSQGGVCSRSAAETCDSCTQTLLQNGRFNTAFFKDPTCFNPQKKQICILSNFYSKEPKKYKIEIK